MTIDQYDSIIEYFKLEPNYFTYQIGTLDHSLEDFTETYISSELYDDEEQERILALMENEGTTYEAAAEMIGDGWKVLTETEADEMARDYAESYAEDAVEEIPEHLRKYFDEDAYISDILSDGRGHILNQYNGNEESETINGTEYFIYSN